MFLNAYDLFDGEKLKIIQQWVDNMPFFIGAKDTTSRFLIVGNCFAKAAGMRSGDSLKGRYDVDVKCELKQIAPLFTTEDTLVTGKRVSLTILTYGFYAHNKPILIYGKKYPITDKNGVTVLGCGFCFQDMTTSQLINLVPLLSMRKTVYGNCRLGNQFSCIIAESIPEYDLSRRQIECLFHLLRGQSANDIAITLNISKRTVETHIDTIKFKLGCDTKSQLIDKAVSTGLLNYIPNSLLSSVLSHNS